MLAVAPPDVSNQIVPATAELGLEVPENFRITDEYLDAFKTLRLNRDFEQPTLFQRMNKALFG